MDGNEVDWLATCRVDKLKRTFTDAPAIRRVPRHVAARDACWATGRVYLLSIKAAQIQNLMMILEVLRERVAP